MPKLRIRLRPGDHSGKRGYDRKIACYPEYVFIGDLGGGTTFALGLDRAGRVLALVYLPPLDSDEWEARRLAKKRIKADVKKVTRVEFRPFKRLEAT